MWGKEGVDIFNNVWMNEYMDEWMDIYIIYMNVRMVDIYRCIKKWIDILIYIWMSGQIYGCMNEWMDRCKDLWMIAYIYDG